MRNSTSGDETQFLVVAVGAWVMHEKANWGFGVLGFWGFRVLKCA